MFEVIVSVIMILFFLGFAFGFPCALLVNLYRILKWKKVIGRIINKGDPIPGDASFYPILLEYWVNRVRHVGDKLADSGMIGDRRILLYNPKKPEQFTCYQPWAWLLTAVLYFFWLLYVFVSLLHPDH